MLGHLIYVNISTQSLIVVIFLTVIMVLYLLFYILVVKVMLSIKQESKRDNFSRRYPVRYEKDDSSISIENPRDWFAYCDCYCLVY